MAKTSSFSDVMDAHEWQAAQQGAFEKDTIHRLAMEAARFWLIRYYLANGKLPEPTTWYAYSNGPAGFGWGNPAGPDDGETPRPLRGKRVAITFSVEDCP